MDDGTEVAEEPELVATAEPVKVRPMSEIQERVAAAMTDLCREFGAGSDNVFAVNDEEGLRNFEHHVATRILQLHREGVALALLQALLVEHLCGVAGKPVVKVPQHVLNRRMAARS